MNNLLQEIEKVLHKHPKLYLWVSKYSVTHRHLHFSLFVDNLLFDRIDISCIGCDHFEGKLQGGPYQLRIDAKNHTEEKAILYATDGSLKIYFDDVVDITPSITKSPN